MANVARDTSGERAASKENILADLEETVNEIEQFTLPKYVATIDSGLFTSDYKLESAWVQKRARLYQSNVRGAGRQFVEHISAMLGVSLKWLGYIADAIDKSVNSDEIHVDGVSYKQKALLDTYGVLKIHVKLARKYLLAIYSYESDDVESNLPGRPNFPFSKAEVLELEQSFAMFCRISNMLDKHKRSELKRIIEAVPDVEVDDTGAAEAVYGSTKLSPLTSGITNFGPIPNPIWVVRKWFASWQADRFKAAEAEAKMLELRLIKMRRKAAGEEDPTLDKQIEYQTKRLADLNYRIHEMEKKYGL